MLCILVVDFIVMQKMHSGNTAAIQWLPTALQQMCVYLHDTISGACRRRGTQSRR